MVNATEVTEWFMHQSATDCEDWRDGSGAYSYASGYVVLFDSHSNPIVICADTEGERAEVMRAVRATDAERWPWESWLTLCDYPDSEMSPEDYRAMTGRAEC